MCKINLIKGIISNFNIQIANRFYLIRNSLMSSVRFACTALAGTNKVGELPQDSDGYYEMVVGGLNMFNSAGQWYTYEGAKNLFEDSSQFIRRVKRGALKGEVGHPRREPGQSMDDYLARIVEIRETNVCVHFKEIYLDFNRLKDGSGKPIIAIMAKLKPSGPFGDQLAKSLANKNENVCFSIRSFTRDFMERGVYTRELKNIITFDAVNEPGISIANKYNAPSLESFDDSLVTRNQVKRVCDKTVFDGLATENSVAIATELLSTMGMTLPVGVTPAFSNWK